MPQLNPAFEVEIKDQQTPTWVFEKLESIISTLQDGLYQIIVRKPIKSRSVMQNAYFHGVIVKILSEETGTDFDDMKDLLKTQFLRKQIIVNDKQYTIVRHTHKLEKGEFEDFTRNCREFGDKLGIYIPLPNESDMGNYQYE